MEGSSKIAEQLFCLGCLCSPEDYKIHDYRIQFAHFWAIFEVSTIKLCYLCKRIAQHAEIFIQNVQTNQILLQNCLGDLTTTIQEARSQLLSSITLSHSPLDPITQTGIQSDNTVFISNGKEFKIHKPVTHNKSKSIDVENSWHEVNLINEDEAREDIEMQKKKIKLVLKGAEAEEEPLDHLDGGFDDENEDFEGPYVKEKDDFPLHLLKKEIQVEAIQVKRIKPTRKKTRTEKDKMFRKTKEPRSNEELGIKKIILSKEDCMQERRQQASDPAYLNFAYKCEDCIIGFNYKAAYDNHLKRHREEVGAFKCEICKLRMNSPDKLLSHNICHTTRFQCTECGIIRTSRTTLLAHHNAIHNQGERQFACPYCVKTYIRQMSRRRHIRYTHQNKERVTCAFCQKTYANKEVMKAHLMLKHPKEVAAIEPTKKFPCEECGMMFRSPSQLKMHGYKHSLSRDYYCVECDKTFKSEVLLRQHLKTARPHISYSDLPLACEQCDKRFAIRRDLERHVNSVHLEVKPFKCDKCDKAYVRNWSLMDHKRTVHEGYKRPLRYPCNFCEKIFDRTPILKAHIRTHTGERPFQCDKCPAQFSQSGALATHNKLVHQRLTRDGKPKQNAGLKKT